MLASVPRNVLSQIVVPVSEAMEDGVIASFPRQSKRQRGHVWGEWAVAVKLLPHGTFGVYLLLSTFLESKTIILIQYGQSAVSVSSIP